MAILRNLTLLLLTLLMLALISFSLAYAFPGDALTNLTGIVFTDSEHSKTVATEFGFDRSVIIQFFIYCYHLVTGNWGMSLVSESPLTQEIMSTLPATLELCLYAIGFSVVVGIPSGCIAGVFAYTKTDHTLNASAIIQYSIPVFWLGLAFILLFCLQLSWLPLSGRISLLYDIPSTTGFLLIDIFLQDDISKSAAVSDALLHLILPTLSLGIVSAAALVRLMRRAVIDVLQQPYISAARSRGFTEFGIFTRHVLKNASVSVLSSIPIQVTMLVTNVMIIETLFSWPGIGNWLLDALYQRDYPAIRAGMFAVSAFIFTLNIIVDILVRYIDPRMSKAYHVAR